MNLKDFLFGKSEYVTENTPTGSKSYNKEIQPNVLERVIRKISGKVNNNPTPTEQYSQPINIPSSQYIPQKVEAIQPTPQTQVQPTQYQTARNPKVTSYNIPEIVHKAITSAAKEFNVPASLLYDIALQESSFDPNKKNPNPDSTAAGLFQFTNGTWDTIDNYSRNNKTSLTNWQGANKMDPYANARAAAYLIAHGQLGRWNASQGVWGPHYSKDELTPYYSQTAQSDIPTSNWR